MIAPPDSPQPKKSVVFPIILTILLGVLLAVGSCFGFIGTLNFSGPTKPINIVFGIGFAAGLAAVLTGCIWAIVAFVRFLLKKSKEPS